MLTSWSVWVVGLVTTGALLAGVELGLSFLHFSVSVEGESATP